MHHKYGYSISNLDFDEEEENYAPAGSAELIIEHKQFALFLTSEWKIIARVGEKHIAVTDSIDHPHSKEFIKRWTLSTIRTNKEQLKKLGVDVEKTYLKFGGNIYDL